MEIKKQYKTYGKRQIKVYDGKKLFGTISTFCHWICIDPVERGEGIKSDIFQKNHDILRKIAMENLWWLLHNDNLDEDITELEAWESKINYWDKGIICGVSIDRQPKSNFLSESEKIIALNSINNK